MHLLKPIFIFFSSRTSKVYPGSSDEFLIQDVDSDVYVKLQNLSLEALGL